MGYFVYMEAIVALKKGGIVLYPTDTVYGLAVDATNREAVRRVQTLKGRSERKPISIAVSDLEMAGNYVVVTVLAKTLAAKFLPGKLTLVLTARDTTVPRGNVVSLATENDHLAPEISAGTGTVGVRIPRHLAVLQLIKDFGKPITATSANVADQPTLSSVTEIIAQFSERKEMISHSIDEGALPASQPSTVVDARGDVPIILREGAISKKDIESVEPISK